MTGKKSKRGEGAELSATPYKKRKCQPVFAETTEVETEAAM